MDSGVLRCALTFLLHIVQEDVFARLEVAIGHYYWVLMNCSITGLPYRILKSFAECYLFLICIVAHSMLFLCHTTSSWFTPACAAVPFCFCHITIYTVLIYALLNFGVMPFGQLCTRLLLRVHNTHSVVQAGRCYTHCKLPWSIYAHCSVHSDLVMYLPLVKSMKVGENHLYSLEQPQ